MKAKHYIQKVFPLHCLCNLPLIHVEQLTAIPGSTPCKKGSLVIIQIFCQMNLKSSSLVFHVSLKQSYLEVFLNQIFHVKQMVSLCEIWCQKTPHQAFRNYFFLEKQELRIVPNNNPSLQTSAPTYLHIQNC